MDRPPSDPQKTLEQIDRLLAEAPDEATRRELTALRARLTAPEIADLAREAKLRRPRERELVLEFHDPMLPMLVTAGGSVIATTICLFAVFTALESPMAFFLGRPMNLWTTAAVAGAFSVMFTALSFARAFSVRIDTMGMISRANGTRWSRLRVGATAWKNIRSLKERGDGVLEVHAAGGEVLDIPMRVGNYQVLREHLENMVRLFGDRPDANAAT
jgi:hypothetical protein